VKSLPAVEIKRLARQPGLQWAVGWPVGPRADGSSTR
jgi:hypothetical protein